MTWNYVTVRNVEKPDLPKPDDEVGWQEYIPQTQHWYDRYQELLKTLMPMEAAMASSWWSTV